MDLNSLKDQVSNLSLYDIKASVRKVQNAMMNYTEMEAKVGTPHPQFIVGTYVREATNNEPWGASSTLMQEIANGTHSYQLLNEIMPMIYKRFTEKTAEEWRQIYKALQLLEFLIKNGSERVVDDARSHISLLRMLRQFHYIDPNGKDQGINIRNRSQELAKLLGDVEMIRSERKKAKANRNKFGGFEGGIGVGGMSSGGFSGGAAGSSRYGGFGSEDTHYGGFSGGVYGDGGGFNGNTSEFQEAGRRSNRFEEYDEGESSGYSVPSRRPEPSSSRAESKKAAPPKAPTPDLVSFGDDDEPAPAPPAAAPPAKAPSSITKPAGTSALTELTPQSMDDDDFDDFQSASPATPATSTTIQSKFGSIVPPGAPGQTQFAAPKPISAAQGASLNGLAGFRSTPQTPSVASTISQGSNMGPLSPSTQSQPPKPTSYQASQPNYFTSVPIPQSKPSEPSTKSTIKSPTASSSKSGGDAFGSLWSSASASAGIKSTTQTQSKGPNLASMAKEKASAGIWGAPSSNGSPQSFGGSPSSQQQNKPSGGSALDDLLG
ncbi:ENTH domain-containing protein c [Arthroderma uncinatum]|uniref:ENTH domain-containing protein c n=1 Tax=Arthroderma uncinatum TaxID=74035 RepID=UPI00144AE032|nr:ENTH domain-containing protein c [Arthroderma uncinatum]KAF3483907.1 ENTH domain-containing protein c [Arthroderma uncinatum]